MSRPLAINIAYIDPLLERWARWGKDGHIGWPEETLLSRVIQQGFTGAAQAGPMPEMDEAVRAIETAVLRLNLKERQVIVKHYVHWQPIEVSARYCHLNPGQFRTLLHRARRRIADFIDGRFCYNNSPAIRTA